MKLFYALILVLFTCLFLSGALLIIPERETIVLSGLVQARELSDASRFGGRVREVLVEEGQEVKKGQVLIRFDDTELRAKIAQVQASLTQAKAREALLHEGADSSDIRQAYAMVQQAEQNLRMVNNSGVVEISQAEATLQSAQAAHNKAKSAFDNAPQMLEAGIISQQKFADISAEYDKARSTLKAAEDTLEQVRRGARNEQVSIGRSKVEAARANYEKLVKGAKKEEIEIAMASIDQVQSELDSLTAQLAEMEVKAKISGVVSILNLAPGELVLPGKPVISIIDYDNLWTDVYVPEDKLYMVKIDEHVTLNASALNKRVHFDGKVIGINPRSEFVPSSQSSLSTEDSAFRVKVRVSRKAQNDDVAWYPGMKVNIKFSRIR